MEFSKRNFVLAKLLIQDIQVTNTQGTNADSLTQPHPGVCSEACDISSGV